MINSRYFLVIFAFICFVAHSQVYDDGFSRDFQSYPNSGSIRELKEREASFAHGPFCSCQGCQRTRVAAESQKRVDRLREEESSRQQELNWKTIELQEKSRIRDMNDAQVIDWGADDLYGNLSHRPKQPLGYQTRRKSIWKNDTSMLVWDSIIDKTSYKDSNDEMRIDIKDLIERLKVMKINEKKFRRRGFEPEEFYSSTCDRERRLIISSPNGSAIFLPCNEESSNVFSYEDSRTKKICHGILVRVDINYVGVLGNEKMLLNHIEKLITSGSIITSPNKIKVNGLLRSVKTWSRTSKVSYFIDGENSHLYFLAQNIPEDFEPKGRAFKVYCK